MPPEYKRAGRIVPDGQPQRTRKRSGFRHGPISAALLVMSVAIGIGLPFVVVVIMKNELTEVIVVTCAAASAVLWLWGCVHLTIHLKLNLLWSLCGFLHFLGLGILLWVGDRAPKWKRRNVATQQQLKRQIDFQSRDGPY